MAAHGQGTVTEEERRRQAGETKWYGELFSPPRPIPARAPAGDEDRTVEKNQGDSSPIGHASTRGSVLNKCNLPWA